MYVCIRMHTYTHILYYYKMIFKSMLTLSPNSYQKHSSDLSKNHMRSVKVMGASTLDWC